MSRRLPDLLFPLLLTSLNLSHAAPITLEFEEIPVKPLFTRGLIPSDVTVPSVTTYVSASPDQWGNQGIYPATLSAYDPTGSLLARSAYQTATVNYSCSVRKRYTASNSPPQHRITR
jgi:hypothetical protein